MDRMSDLGAIFHVKKNGVQYDAHAYTTTDECPEPNLKIKFNGQQAYVKLEQGKGHGDVPCYVKDKAGVVYQVRKEAIPSGIKEYPYWTSSYTTTLTVPYGIHVIKSYNWYPTSQKPIQSVKYIGVTAGKTYTFDMQNKRVSHHYESTMVNKESQVEWGKPGSGKQSYLRLEWSPEINKETPTVTDY